MKTTSNILPALYAAIAIGIGAVSDAQLTNSTEPKLVDWVLSTVTLSGDIDGVTNKAFICRLLHPLKKGDKLDSRMSFALGQGWAFQTCPMRIGTQQVAYPISALVRCSDGKAQNLFPAVMEVKIDIKAGEVVHSEGYQIESSRSVKAGESIPSLFVGESSVLSIETAEGTNTTKDVRPCITAFKEDVKPNDRSTAIEAWRIEKERVGQ